MEFDVGNKNGFAYTGGRPLSGTGPTLVFIHGAQHDHSVWGLQSRALAHAGHSVMALDLPGHGRSAGPALSTVEAMSAWVIAVLDQLGVSDAVLVGHSMGSLIALETAGSAPERVRGLALLATAYPMAVSDALLDAASKDENRAMDMINLWSHSSAFGGFSHKPQAPAPGFCEVWANLRLMQRQAPGVLANDFSACNAYRNAEVAARNYHGPVLIVLGERDTMTSPKTGRAVASLFDNVSVKVLPKVGHALMAEAPDAIRSLLGEFAAATAKGLKPDRVAR